MLSLLGDESIPGINTEHLDVCGLGGENDTLEIFLSVDGHVTYLWLLSVCTFWASPSGEKL